MTTKANEDRTYGSIAEVRAAFYPRSARLLDLPDDAIIEFPMDGPAEMVSREVIHDARRLMERRDRIQQVRC